MTATALLDRPLPVTVIAPPENVGKTSCDSCGHPRNNHSSKKCVWTEVNGQECSCTQKYMDL
jgi:hypothetical protein